MKIAAFDIETGNSGEGAGLDPRNHLGILCAALLPYGQSTPRLWFGGGELPPAPKLGRDEAVALLEALEECVEQGYYIVTWNGLGFDFHVLAVETGEHARCARLAMDHVDLMFLFVSVEGHPISLATAAEACGTSKSQALTGVEASFYWAQGRYREVLDYLAQDVQATLKVAEHLLSHRGFVWRSRTSDRFRAFRLPEAVMGLEDMTVRRCLSLQVSNLRRPADKEKLRYLRWVSEPSF